MNWHPLPSASRIFKNSLLNFHWNSWRIKYYNQLSLYPISFATVGILSELGIPLTRAAGFTYCDKFSFILAFISKNRILTRCKIVIVT